MGDVQKKGGQAETKPFTNFSVFHDNLITRLKALSQIQLDFDKRCKDVEGRFTEKLTEMRKQLDNRWKQIDKFETSVKSYAETKATWRRKFSTKEGELEAVKVGSFLFHVIRNLPQLTPVTITGDQFRNGRTTRWHQAPRANGYNGVTITLNACCKCGEKIGQCPESAHCGGREGGEYESEEYGC